MTTNIRDAVFETNSSSTHSLTIVPDEVLDFGIDKQSLRDGVLIIRPEEYGAEWRRFYSPASKIAYLITQVCGTFFNGRRNSKDLAEKVRTRFPAAAFIMDTVEKATGCAIKFAPVGEGAVTFHAYVETNSGGVGMELLDDEQALLSFIFSKNSCVQLGNDNYEPGEFIVTDRGNERFYAALYADTPAGDDEFQFGIGGRSSKTITFSSQRHGEVEFDTRHLGDQDEVLDALAGSTCTAAQLREGSEKVPLHHQRSRDIVFQLLSGFNPDDATEIKLLESAEITGMASYNSVSSWECEFLGTFRADPKVADRVWSVMNEKANRPVGVLQR